MINKQALMAEDKAKKPSLLFPGCKYFIGKGVNGKHGVTVINGLRDIFGIKLGCVIAAGLRVLLLESFFPIFILLILLILYIGSIRIDYTPT